MAGVVKWISGKFKEALVALTSEVTGVLPVANGGTATTNRTLLDSGSALALEWSARRLIHANGTQVLDWSSGTIRDSIGFPSVLWGSRVLQDATGITVLSWTAKTLIDAVSKTSMNWSTRLAFDTAATPKISINWDSRLLTDTVEGLSVSWGSRILSDSAGLNALHWNNRLLTNTAGVDTVDWEFCRQYDLAGGVANNWTTRTLTDGDGNVSMSYGANNRKLYAATGATVFNWDTYILYNSLAAAALNFSGTIALLLGRWKAVSAIEYTIFDCVNVANVFTTAPQNGKIQRVNMVANSTVVMGTTNVYDGQQMIIEARQSNAGNYTLTLPTAANGDCKFGAQITNTANVQSATVGHVAIIGLIYNLTKQRWMVTSCIGGY